MTKKKKVPLSDEDKAQKFGGAVGIQFCIDGVLMSEVLTSIPEGIKILGAEVELGTCSGSSRIAVPNALKKIGVQTLTQTTANKRAFLVFDQINPKAMIKSVTEAARILGLNSKNALFRYLLLGHKDSTALFKRVTKEIRPYDEDQRKKLKVLGLTAGTGKVMSLCAALGTRKYKCLFREEVKRIAICSPE